VTYRVIVTTQAQKDIRSEYHYIQKDSPPNAMRWVQDVYDRIATLETMPGRCGAARENAYFDEELKQLIFKSHRLVFWIYEVKKEVYVLFVRHARRQTVGEKDSL